MAPLLPLAELVRIRSEYSRGGLREADADDCPTRQLERWLAEAVSSGLSHPNAMTLATADRDGVPNARIVLVRGLDERGITFFTNRESAKGEELAANPKAAIVFFWPELERQVRIRGDVELTPDEESAAYFAGRPRGSQIAAWASRQSQAIASREALEAEVRGMEARFPNDVPLPPFWGGYRLRPSHFEFWQGRPSRLHDRLLYERSPGSPGHPDPGSPGAPRTPGSPGHPDPGSPGTPRTPGGGWLRRRLAP